ncbi:helix-turn-helix domain-containing protein [Streptomyces sp. NPDC048442]|uniref:helix-turn-helix domain-containing protein n=1 Tax=Streptomyces sp. NPDC048442 TaxID=3154823 RepID=UPI003422DBBC
MTTLDEVRDDGTVLVPARLVSTVFAATALYLADQTRANGGALTPEARTFLRALHGAAQSPAPAAPEPGSASDTPTPGAANVDHGSRIVGVAEAAGLLGCHPSYVRRLCHAGRIPATRITGGWVIERTALDHYRHGGTPDGIAGPTPTP